MTEFLARIIGINRVISQDRGDRTSMTLEQSESIPANKNKTATRVYLLFLQYHWRCWIYKTVYVHVVIRKGVIREITHNGVGTINPCLKCCSVFCFALQHHKKFLISWRKTGAPYQYFFKERSDSVKLGNEREWQAGREYSSLRSNGLFVL